MDNRIKKIIIVILILVVSIFVLVCIAFPATPKWAMDTLSQYASVPYHNSRIWFRKGVVDWSAKGSVVLVESVEELEALELETPGHNVVLNYNENFFTENALLLISYTNPTGETVRALSGLIVRDEVIHPVVTIDSQEVLAMDMQETLITAVVRKEDVKHPLGDILVINKFDSSAGSSHYEKLE